WLGRWRWQKSRDKQRASEDVLSSPRPVRNSSDKTRYWQPRGAAVNQGHTTLANCRPSGAKKNAPGSGLRHFPAAAFFFFISSTLASVLSGSARASFSQPLQQRKTGWSLIINLIGAPAQPSLSSGITAHHSCASTNF